MPSLHAKQGFTLLELMIVVGVIGILAMIAIPAYQSYTIRAKIAEIITISSEMKASVSSCIQSRSSAADCSAVNADIDEAFVAASSRFISSVVVTQGIIQVNPNWAELGDSSVDGYIEFRPTVAGSTMWACQYKDVTPSIIEYLPSSCRNLAP